ncbi:DivIVA domain protein [Saccharomonospora xinjiangensis]|nr:hypothetical protein EYD13_03555 [Saccharomonospora xinjiangensis]
MSVAVQDRTAKPPARGWLAKRTRARRVCHDRGVTTALIYLLVMLLVAAVVFLLASLVFGRGEELAPLPPGSSPTRLPADDITSADVNDVRFQVVLRGYKMSEVDWVMSRLGTEIDLLRARVAELEADRADVEVHRE